METKENEIGAGEREIRDNFRAKQIGAADTGNFNTTFKSVRPLRSQLCQQRWHILIQTPLGVKSVGIKTELPSKHRTAKKRNPPRWCGPMLQERDENPDIPLGKTAPLRV